MRHTSDHQKDHRIQRRRPGRIGLYAAFLDPARMGGAETYTRCLITELMNLDGDHQFVIFAARDHGLKITNDRFEVVECNVNANHRKRRILWEQLVLPRVLKKHDLDLVHFPYGTMPCFYGGRSLVTVHDTLRFCFPDQMPSWQRAYRKLIENRIAATGRDVISVSHADSEILAANLKIPRERISVIYHGVLEKFFLNKPVFAADPQRRDLLWIGRPYPRKNVEVLLEAYRILKQKGLNLPLIRLVGIEGADMEKFRKIGEALGITSLISLEPPMSHETLLQRFQNAVLFVYPSKYESFGLPVLEAMASGVPALCADIPPFRELYGDSVAYADPDSPNDFAAAIEKLLDDTTLRTRLAQSARKKAAQYDWKKCAQNTYELYRKLIADAATIKSVTQRAA